MSKQRNGSVIEVVGGGFSNKGAELMLRSTVAAVGQRLPSARMVMNYEVGDRSQRRSLGLHDVVWSHSWKWPVFSRVHNAVALVAARMPPVDDERAPAVPRQSKMARAARALLSARVVRSKWSLIPGDVDFVLDISGFTYGDVWGSKVMAQRAAYYQLIRAGGGSVILLPQQFGPFQVPEVRSAFRDLSSYVDLIYARDDLSFQMATSAAADPTKVRLAPDFTVDTVPTMAVPGRLRGKACIIPNSKMLEMAGPEVARAYPRFLISAIELLRECSVEAFVLIHNTDGSDAALAGSLQRELQDLEVHTEEDPLATKAIIGSSYAVVGSRFHGLVSALSQKVPSIGTGWSHKYQMLFSDYGCPEYLVDPRVDGSCLAELIQRLTSRHTREELISKLAAAEKVRTAQVRSMWDEVVEFIGTRAASEQVAVR